MIFLLILLLLYLVGIFLSYKYNSEPYESAGSNLFFAALWPITVAYALLGELLVWLLSRKVA